MKNISNFIVGISKIILSIINIILIIVIVLNILLLISEKVLKSEYPCILDYTYFVSEENISNLNINKGNLLLVDTRTSSDSDDIIVYKENDKLLYGKVIESDNYSATIENNKKINNEDIIGIILINVEKVGAIVNNLLTIKTLIISIIVITITGVLQGLLNKKKKRDNQVKPDFANMKNI